MGFSTRALTQAFFHILFALVPLVMFHRTSEIFEFNKILVIYTISGIIFALWIAESIRSRSIIIKKTPLDVPILVFLVSQAIATLFSIDRQTSVFGYYGRFSGGLLSLVCYSLLYFAFVRFVTDNEDSTRARITSVTAYLKTTLFATGLVIVWGLPGKFGHDLSCWLFTGTLSNACWTAQFKPAERMFSTLGQPNWLGAYLSVAFFVGLYFLFRPHFLKKTIPSSPWPHWLRSLGVFLFLQLVYISLLWTRSRSALFALAVGICFTFIASVVLGIRHKKQLVSFLVAYRIKWAALATVMVLITAVVGTGIAQVDRVLQLRFATDVPASITKSVDAPAVTTGISSSADIRKIVWAGAAQLGFENFFIGTGVETFAYAYYGTRPVEHNMTSEWDYIYNKAHNEYLNFFATTGVFGLLSYLSIFLILTLVVVKSIMHSDAHSTSEKTFLVIVLSAAVYAILISNFFGFSTTTSNVLLFTLMAMIITLSGSYGERFVSLPSLPFSRGVSMVVAGALILTVLTFASRYFTADLNYARGEGLNTRQDFVSARTYLERAYELRKEHVYADKLSSVYASLAFITGLDLVDTGVEGENLQDKSADEVRQLYELSEYFSKRSLQESPGNVQYHKTRAKNQYVFYQLTADETFFQGSIQALKDAQLLAPTDPKILYTQALFILLRYENESDLELKTEKLREGLEAAERASAMKRDYRDAHFVRGLIEKELGDLESAAQRFKFIIEHIAPDDTQSKEELKNITR